MNRLIISFLIFVCAIALRAQELTVVSMQPTMDVLTANDLRKDLNGNYCAVVYVQTTEPGLEFQGNVIGDVPFKKSQYMVYLTSGSKNLRIMGDTFVPVTINFSDYGIDQLEGKRVYALNIDVPSSNGPKKMDLGENYATFTLTPKSGAVIYIDNGDGEPFSDGEWRGRLPYGEHHYRITAKGYRESSGTITVVKGEPTQKDIFLESLLAQLSVKSSTADAKIYIDGELKGTGSYTGSMPAGRYVVEARHPSYITYSEVVTLEESGSKTLNIPALTALTGTLDIDYSPTGTTIQIDGTDYGTSPRLVYDLPVGNHAVTLSKEGYEPTFLVVTIKEGEIETLKGALDKPVASSSQNDIKFDGKSAQELFDLGKKRYDEKKYTEAIEYLKLADSKGHEEAPLYLGYCYAFGFGVLEDNAKALEYYRKSADYGIAEAMESVGHCYYIGSGIAKDQQKALEWFMKAADLGDERAMDYVGDCYFYGRGTTQDYQKAAEWYRNAADHGDVVALAKLGHCYEEGKGVTQDISKAKEIYVKAANKGSYDAKNRLKELNK